MMALLSWFLVGLVAGLIARVLVRPHANFGCIITGILGMAGSMVGGLVANLATDHVWEFSRTGLAGSIVGSVVVMVIVRLALNRR